MAAAQDADLLSSTLLDDQRRFNETERVFNLINKLGWLKQNEPSISE